MLNEKQSLRIKSSTVTAFLNDKLQNTSKNFQNMSKKLNIQSMSFLKIKDPSKRDKLVAEYLKTKKKIEG